MQRQHHEARLRKYYARSRVGYNLFLGGAKHFGYHPAGEQVSEQRAQDLMHEQVANALHLDQRMHVLDAGCGQGIVATWLARTIGCTVSGVTIVPFEVTSAQRVASAAQQSDRTQFFLMDYSQLAFPDSMFDALFTMETLSHSFDVRKTLSEFRRVLAPGARVAFFEYSIAPDNEFNTRDARVLNAIAAGSAMAGLYEFRHDSFDQVIHQAGFVDVTTTNLTANALPSLRRLRRYALVPYLVVRALRAQRLFPNVSAAVECHRMVKAGLIRYNLYTARTPDS